MRAPDGTARSKRNRPEDYALPPDGQRASVIEKRYDGQSVDPFSKVKIDWTCDALNRLVAEMRDVDPTPGTDTPEDFGTPDATLRDCTDFFAFDLAGNRLLKQRGWDANGNGQWDAGEPVSERTAYRYNARDQLLEETTDSNAYGTPDSSAVYAYDDNGSTLSVTHSDQTVLRYVWDLRNKLVGLDANGDETLDDAGDATFAYDFAGVRVRRSVIGDQTTYYLQTLTNPTGYSQVLEEWTGPNGQSTRTLARSYLIGQDVIAQADATSRLTEQWQFTWNNGTQDVPFLMEQADASSYAGTVTVGEPGSEQTYYATATRNPLDGRVFHIEIRLTDAQGLVLFSADVAFTDRSGAGPQDFGYVSSPLAGLQYLLYDGGGHTRALLDPTGQVLDGRLYAYDAHGNRIDPDRPAIAATNLLYRGEYFDAALGQYVLRARYYDPASGRFWSFDSYEASSSDPLSLHKYRYAAANPIHFNDPSGNYPALIDTLAANSLKFVGRVAPAAAAAYSLGGRFLGRFNQVVGAYAERISEQILRLYNLAPQSVNVGRSQIDWFVRQGNRFAAIEVKYRIPDRLGGAFNRLVNQISSGVAYINAELASSGKAQQMAGQMVVWSLRQPSNADLARLQTAVGPTVFNSVQFVHGVTGLAQWIEFFFRINAVK